ncbi:MAG TPA: AraC family transcriptional regulator ligand-binding domain-containing protein [Polyangiaceae bacterium]|nr:AraC family transcriptional regulator ligand-binding domain-containing protein [Polyangiaceae bacterium]
MTDTISAALVLRVVRLLERRGARVGSLLATAGIATETLDLEGARIDYAAADRLLEVAAVEIGPAQLGLELALTRIDESYGAPGLLLLTAPSFREGLLRAFAYQRLWGDGQRFRLSTTAGDAVIAFRHPGASRLAAAVTAECALVEVVEGLRALVERDATPRLVEFAHEPLGDFGALAEHLGIEPRFGARESAVVLPAALVDRPMHGVRALLSEAFERTAARALSLLPRRDSISERVKPLLAGEVGVARSLANVADALRMSPRTLQRRLRSEGVRFDDLLDDARRALALKLAAEGLSSKEVAFRVGFQDASALLRARRRWQA